MEKYSTPKIKLALWDVSDRLYYITVRRGSGKDGGVVRRLKSKVGTTV